MRRGTAKPHLYFCGFNLSPNGMLREIGIEAKRIARKLATARATSPPESLLISNLKNHSSHHMLSAHWRAP